jgi:hypothetical protein
MTSEKWLPIDDIRADGGTQIREKLHIDTIGEYAEAMADGAEFPPVDVFWDGNGHYWLADGGHRLQAAIKAEKGKIKCRIHKGELRDAIWFALSANKGHGLRLNAADKKNKILKALADAEWKSKVDRELAGHIGVSLSYFHDVRSQLSGPESSPPPKRKGKDGKAYPSRYTKRKPAAPKPDPADEPEVGEEPTLAECCEADNKLIESFCRGLVKYFEDNVPHVFWAEDSGRIESALGSVRAACGTLRAAKAVVCPACEGGQGKNGKCGYCKATGYLPTHQAYQIPAEMRL